MRTIVIAFTVLFCSVSGANYQTAQELATSLREAIPDSANDYTLQQERTLDKQSGVLNGLTQLTQLLAENEDSPNYLYASAMHGAGSVLVGKGNDNVEEMDAHASQAYTDWTDGNSDYDNEYWIDAASHYVNCLHEFQVAKDAGYDGEVAYIMAGNILYLGIQALM